MVVAGIDVVVLLVSEHIGNNRMRKETLPHLKREGMSSLVTAIVVIPRCPSLSHVIVGESGDVAALSSKNL